MVIIISSFMTCKKKLINNIKYKIINTAQRVSLDPYADTSTLTPNADWVKCYFSVAISSYLPPSPIFHQSALGVEALMSA